jgi:hypothetical protein
MRPPTSATLIGPDQPFQRQGPFETCRPPTSATLIRPDQPFQRQGPFETSNKCDPDQA